MAGSKGRCKGCKAELTWAVNENGKGLPLDPDPVDEGDHLIDGYQDDGRPIVHRIGRDEEVPTGAQRYQTHFESCPNASDFAKPREARQ